MDASLFEAFDYVALGHIHGAQWVGKETIRYAGTPLKYSFAEAAHHKTVTIVELREKGKTEIRKIPLVPLRDLRKLKGTYEELTRRSAYEDMNIEDYVQITLTDEKDIFDAAAKLRVIYPNLMKMEYNNGCSEKGTDEPAEVEAERMPITYMKELFYMQNERPMSAIQEDYLAKLIEAVWEETS